MFDKLEDLLIRYEELMSELSEPDVANNPERFRKLMKEQSDILPIVEAYKEYKQCKQNIEDSLAMLEEESDEEMRELAKEELNDAKNRVAELENELKSITDSMQLEDWINANKDQKLDFGEYLNRLLDEKGVKMSELYMRNAVGKSFTYYIRNGEKRPSKKTVIKVAFALNATVEETNLLLKSSGNKELYPRQEEDSIIEFGLRNHLNVYQVEELLKKRGSKMSLLDKEKNKK